MTRTASGNIEKHTLRRWDQDVSRDSWGISNDHALNVQDGLGHGPSTRYTRALFLHKSSSIYTPIHLLTVYGILKTHTPD